MDFAALNEHLGGILKSESFRDNTRLIVPAAQLDDLMSHLKHHLGFDMLSDVTCCDYLEYPGAADRYGVIYVVVNTKTRERLVVKTFVNDPAPTLPSMYRHWKTADWTEREVYDLFGIHFTGHPNLQRILCPPEFESHALRKDYPLKGRGERHNFPVITRAES